MGDPVEGEVTEEATPTVDTPIGAVRAPAEETQAVDNRAEPMLTDRATTIARPLTARPSIVRRSTGSRLSVSPWIVSRLLVNRWIVSRLLGSRWIVSQTLVQP